jgi:hypothetical protein
MTTAATTSDSTDRGTSLIRVLFLFSVLPWCPPGADILGTPGETGWLRRRADEGRS